MKKYRYYLLASFTCIIAAAFSAYYFGILQGEHTIWIGFILSPLITLTAIAFTNFDKQNKNTKYSQGRFDNVKSTSAAPIRLIKSPILWLGLISLSVVAGFVLI